MSFVCVTEDQHGLLPYSRYIIDSVAFFRGNLRSVEQAKLLLENEYAAWRMMGAEAYVPSEISSMLLEATNRRTESVYVAGVFGLALMGLAATEKKPSFTKAYELTAEYCSQTYQSSFDFWNHGERQFESINRSVSSSPRAVRRVVDEQRSSIHICAARLASNDYLQPLAPFEPASVADRAYLATAMAFQGYFSIFDQEGRDDRSKPLRLAHIGTHRGFALGVEPLYPADQLMRAILKIQ